MRTTQHHLHATVDCQISALDNIVGGSRSLIGDAPASGPDQLPLQLFPLPDTNDISGSSIKSLRISENLHNRT
jgi:hypothetical protein